MPVLQFRVALTTEDFERVTAFYRDGLGLDPGDLWTTEEGGHGQLLFAGQQATLEVFDRDYAAHIDDLEVGERVSGQIRFAFEVPDVHAAVEQALAYGAEIVHKPKLTPWGDLNARLRSPDGLQVTLFQNLNDLS
ncbi:MAG TPA: VOC family protein [Anaerolineales bacterium]|nr:VOC family protein [Anaerolineales bacterium]